MSRKRPAPSRKIRQWTKWTPDGHPSRRRFPRNDGVHNPNVFLTAAKPTVQLAEIRDALWPTEADERPTLSRLFNYKPDRIAIDSDSDLLIYETVCRLDPIASVS
jgi:hypothetical protein